MFGFLENKRFDSRTKEESVSLSEKAFGYLAGPAMCFLVTNALAGHYLTQFYTDVIGVSGTVIAVMPFISKIFASFTNLFFGSLIDKTSSSQGKARPWILISGILLFVSGVLLYAIPKASETVQILWIIFSYNLFFAGSNNIYHLSHALLLPRSTRDVRERDQLSLLKNVSEAMIPGTLSAVIMPLLIRRFGVGPLAQSNWFQFMLMVSILALPGSLFEYFFTRERVRDEKKKETYSFSKQFRDCIQDKRWLLVILLFAIKTLEGYIVNGSQIYYCNWVLSDSVAGGTSKQVLFNVIGQAPLGPGIFIMMPLIKKIGKERAMKIGYLVAAAGSLFAYLNPGNFHMVLAGIFVKSIGSIPGFLSMSLLSDIIDEFEKKNGYRCDTFSITVTTILSMAGSGLAQSIILSGIHLTGYIAPSSTTEIITQSAAVKGFFNFSLNGVAFIGFLVSFLIVTALNKKRSEA